VTLPSALSSHSGASVLTHGDELTPGLPQHLTAFALVALDAGVRVVRFRTLVSVSLWRAAVVTVCGDAAAAVTPARVGGDPVRFLGFRRSGAPASGVLAAFALEVCADAVIIGATILLLWATMARVGAWPAFAAGLPHSRGAAAAVVAVVAASVLCAAAAARFGGRAAKAFGLSLREILHRARRHPPRSLAIVLGLSVVSWAARAAVLPALAAGAPRTTILSLVLGSLALLVVQVFAPTPAGVGAVDLAFLAGFSGRLRSGDVLRLLALWRFYTCALAILVGGSLLARAAWKRRTRSRGGASGRAGTPEPEEMQPVTEV